MPAPLTLTAGSTGPGPSTNTTVTDQLPAGVTVYGATPSQGTCSSTGSPALVTCDLGTVANGASATVSLVVADSNTASVTNTASVSNDQAATATASATTQVNPASTTTTTPPTTPMIAAPTALSAGTASVTRASAVLHGQVSTGGQATGCFFQYGRTHAYGRATPVATTSSGQDVTGKVTGLTTRAPHRYTLAGKLMLPHGVGRTQGCSGP